VLLARLLLLAWSGGSWQGAAARACDDGTGALRCHWQRRLQRLFALCGEFWPRLLAGLWLLLLL
jgi:hypothetical protein